MRAIGLEGTLTCKRGTEERAKVLLMSAREVMHAAAWKGDGYVLGGVHGQRERQGGSCMIVVLCTEACAWACAAYADHAFVGQERGSVLFDCDAKKCTVVGKGCTFGAGGGATSEPAPAQAAAEERTSAAAAEGAGGATVAAAGCAWTSGVWLLSLVPALMAAARRARRGCRWWVAVGVAGCWGATMSIC
jgi:hypothetical protein